MSRTQRPKTSPRIKVMYQQVGNETRAEGVTDGLEMGRTVADSPVPGLVLDVALASAG